MTREEAIGKWIYPAISTMWTATTCNEILDALEQEPKTGHWISIEERTDWYDATYECSCCGRQIITSYELSKNLYEQYPYCHCGAKMVEPTGK